PNVAAQPRMRELCKKEPCGGVVAGFERQKQSFNCATGMKISPWGRFHFSSQHARVREGRRK
ncbi:MAG TPA: hypothetical protein PK863_06895, partial [Candidatus Dojkabacteria bacterium]|nr:hypothetical protein [Candidatus Dojkabacteria bacterium]